MVTITTQAPEHTYGTLVSTMLDAMKQTPSITPRPKHKIIMALKNNDIALAFDGPQLIGWLIATPYSTEVQEIGMAYLLPDYRGKGHLDRLIAPLIKKRAVNIAVTYDRRLAIQLEKKWSFQSSSLHDFQHITKHGFLLQRFKSPVSAISVIRHITKKRPFYLARNSAHEK